MAASLASCCLTSPQKAVNDAGRLYAMPLADRPQVDYPPVVVAVGRVPKHRPFALGRAAEDTP
jgi:hypothetical protein